MRGAVYDGCGTTGHGRFPPTQVKATQSKVFIQGKPAVIHGDPIIAHSDGDSTHGGNVIATTGKIYVQGVKLALMGDSISCGDMISKSSSVVSGK